MRTVKGHCGARRYTESEEIPRCAATVRTSRSRSSEAPCGAPGPLGAASRSRATRGPRARAHSGPAAPWCPREGAWGPGPGPGRARRGSGPGRAASRQRLAEAAAITAGRGLGGPEDVTAPRTGPQPRREPAPGARRDLHGWRDFGHEMDFMAGGTSVTVRAPVARRGDPEALDSRLTYVRSRSHGFGSTGSAGPWARSSRGSAGRTSVRTPSTSSLARARSRRGPS
jgi:hypothetical protein